MPFLAPLVIPALVGAAIGAGTASVTGGDVGRGAIFGAIGGAAFGAFAPAGSGLGTVGGGPLDPATAGLFGTGGQFSFGVAAKSLSIIASIAGTGLALSGQKEGDEAAALTADQNAERLRVQAAQEEVVIREEQKRVVEEGERRKSRLRVLAANAGIDLVGTPLLIEEEIAGVFEEERQFVRQAGRQRRFGLEFAAGQQTTRARNIRRASRFRTGTSLLTGATTIASLAA